MQRRDESSLATVGLWFDPICPYAWITSRWLLEVERVREVSVNLQVMSLSVLNAGRPDVSESSVRRGWGPVRVMIATSLAYGQDAVRALYGAMGALIHEERVRVGRDLYARALDRARLPHTLANAALTTVYDDAVRASHEDGVADLGDAAASPVIHLPGPDGRVAVFAGPVLTPTPRGEAAGDLWDGLVRVARSDEFFEIRRSRTSRPDFT
jgi:hypothetical protein